MTQPTERDLSYRERQRAAAASARGTWAYRNGTVTPERMPRKVRRGLAAIMRSAATLGERTKAAGRLLHVDPVTAREWLERVPASLVAKAKPRVRAFNAPVYHPLSVTPETAELERASNRTFRNAAKAQRRARAAR